MKLKILVFGALLGLVATWQACRTEQREEQPSPAPVNDKAKPHHGGPQMRVTYQMFSEIQAWVNADPSVAMTPVPSGYTLDKEGVWDYSEAYLVVAVVDGSVVNEVYCFCSPNDYEDAMLVCDKDWVSVIENGQIVGASCDNDGDDCEVTTKDNSICLKQCQ